MNGTYDNSYFALVDSERLAVLNQVQHTDECGGGTFKRFGKSVDFLAGYMVGGIVDTVVIPVSAGSTAFCNAFTAFQYRMGTNAGNTLYFGTWIDMDGNCHIDASQHIDDLQEAVAIARERGEIAIWDCKHGAAIFCKHVYTGEDTDPNGYPDVGGMHSGEHVE